VVAHLSRNSVLTTLSQTREAVASDNRSAVRTACGYPALPSGAAGLEY
jgi:hypothetical protein